MIGRIVGVLAAKQPPQVLVDVNGVGYELDVPMSTFYNLPDMGARVTLYTHLVVREDAHLLYGFLTENERRAFRLLTRISGIGAKMALAVLSGLSVAELAQAVTMQESGRLTKIPGIGKKTAERILVELRDKAADLVLGGGTRLSGASGAVPLDPQSEAAAALQALGYKPPDALRMARQAAVEGDDAEAIIRKALKAALKA